MIALAHLPGLLRGLHVLVAHHQCQLGPGRLDAAPQIGAVGHHRIADQFVLERAGQIEFGAARADVDARQADAQQLSCDADGPALDRERQHDHDEGDVEIEMRAGQADQHRDRGEEHRHRAAQADPRDEHLFPEAEAEWRKADQHRGGPRDQHQAQCHGKRRQQALRQPVGPGQQAEQDEHGDLRQPGRGIEERHDDVVGAGLAIADDQPGDIDREEAGAVQRFGQAERHQRADGDERRVHPLRQHQAVEHQDDGAAADPAKEAADDGFLGQQGGDVGPWRAAGEQYLDQDDGEKDRERIVDAGLDLERCGNARAKPQSLGVKQEEHRRGIGRGHHSTDQQPLVPVQLQRPDGDRRGQRHGDQDAGGRQHARRGEHIAERREPRTQPAVEQDQGERHRPDRIGQPHVVELDAADAGFAGQHADQEEHEQQRRAEAQRHQTRHNAGEHQHGAEQDGDADCVDRCHDALPLLLKGRWAQRNDKTAASA